MRKLFIYSDMKISQKYILHVKQQGTQMYNILLVLKRIKINLYLLVHVHKISLKLLTKVARGEEWVGVKNRWEGNITICLFFWII